MCLHECHYFPRWRGAEACPPQPLPQPPFPLCSGRSRVALAVSAADFRLFWLLDPLLGSPSPPEGGCFGDVCVWVYVCCVETKGLLFRLKIQTNQNLKAWVAIVKMRERFAGVKTRGGSPWKRETTPDSVFRSSNKIERERELKKCVIINQIVNRENEARL